MPRIKEALRLARKRYVQGKSIVALSAMKGLAAIGLRGTRTAANNKFEIIQAAFPDKISDTRRTKPGT